MATAKKTVKKTPAKKSATPKVDARKPAAKPTLFTKLKRRISEYRAKRPQRSFRRTKWAKKRIGGKPVASISNLFLGTYKVIWQEKRVVLGLTLIYGVVCF